MRRGLSIGIFLVCVLVSVGGLVNVMADNAEVIQEAYALACGEQGAGCRAQLTRMEKSPIAQSFEVVTSKRTVAVRCSRSLVFFGDYACALR